ncbi:MAG: NAD(+) synthase [Oscillospiraceae bacterium]|nr:NAD(+) synthase [Oscillospiraceae bacterium]
MLDFIRISCAVPAVRVGDVVKNAEEICRYIEKADAGNSDLVVFPELALTGYSCGDLFFQQSLHDAVKVGLRKIAECTAAHPGIHAVVGLPLKVKGNLYNCAALIAGGDVRGIVPKTHIPNYHGFYEKRWFASGKDVEQIWIDGKDLGLKDPDDCFVGADMARNFLFDIGEGTLVGVEICEDLMGPMAESSALAMGGAEVIVNLAASPEAIGKRAFRQDLVKHQSKACCCAYAFCSAGCTESTQDTVFSGHSLIAQQGKILAENAKQIDGDYMITMDCDLGRIRADRMVSKHFGEDRNVVDQGWSENILRADGTLYPLRKLPFVPSNQTERAQRCEEIFNIQVAALKQRLATINANAVIGISGGLDSTLALLVAVEATRQLGKPLSTVYGVTMPCFGTSDRTYQNSWELMKTLGITAKEINIRNAVTQHFADIGHDISKHDGTYENSQARERTQILMDYASIVGGIVVGTGDLSELALGWCTYNGDHMSMYGVNADIPKTLIRWIIETVAQKPEFAASRAVLEDILDTPISPELLPPDAEGKISQQTEDIVGPYALHDFFLYYMLRFGFTPTKIYALACRAFKDDFDGDTIKKWLKTFYRRFFTQQFKRSCVPDGASVGSVGLSPRSTWRMPSDASGRIWLDEIEKL